MVLRMFTAADLPQLTTWLRDAMAAQAVEASGGRVTSVSVEGKSVGYAGPMNSADRMQWITNLQDTIAFLTGAYKPRGPIHFTF